MAEVRVFSLDAVDAETETQGGVAAELFDLGWSEALTAVETEVEVGAAEELTDLDVAFPHELHKFWLTRWWKRVRGYVEAEGRREAVEPLLELMFGFGEVLMEASGCKGVDLGGEEGGSTAGSIEQTAQGDFGQV